MADLGQAFRELQQWQATHPQVKLLSANDNSLSLEVEDNETSVSVSVTLLRLDEGGFFLEAEGETDEEVEDWATELNSLFSDKPSMSLVEALDALVAQPPSTQKEDLELPEVVESMAVGPTEERPKRKVMEEDECWEALVKESAAKGSRQASQVLMREMRALLALEGDAEGSKAMEIEMVKDSLYHWSVKMFAAGFPECPLRSELQNFASETSGQAAVVLEVLFPDTYPMQPPFIRIVRPRFQMHTGHITVGGSICMQLLTPSGWLPTVSLENVFVAIRSEMVEGGGRLDLTCKRDYSVQEAREAFQRVAHRYGWLR